MNLFESEPTIHIREEIRTLPAYKQGRPAPADAFKLSSNETPLGASPQAITQNADGTPGTSVAGIAARPETGRNTPNLVTSPSADSLTAAI